MERIINNIGTTLYECMGEPDAWGTILLPGKYDITFELEYDCVLELRKLSLPGCASVIKTTSFPTLKKGDWITIDDFKTELSKLFKGLKFSSNQIKKYLK